jgi:hypothetical protein
MKNVSEIRSLPKIFGQSSIDFGFEYYFDPENEKIYLEYNIYGDVQYVFCYEIVTDEDVFMFVISQSISVGFESSPPSKEFGIAGKGENEREAIQFLIEKILEKPKKNIGIKIELEALKKSLETVLLI